MTIRYMPVCLSSENGVYRIRPIYFWLCLSLDILDRLVQACRLFNVEDAAVMLTLVTDD